jgi:hypothetical protein
LGGGFVQLLLELRLWIVYDKKEIVQFNSPSALWVFVLAVLVELVMQFLEDGQHVMRPVEGIDIYLWQVDAGNNGDIQGRRGVLLGSRGIAVGKVLVLGILASLPRLGSGDFADSLFL